MTLRRQILAELVWRGTITPNRADELLGPLESHSGNAVDYLLGKGVEMDEVLAAASTAAGVPLAPPHRVREPLETSMDVATCLAAGGIPIAQRGNLTCVAWADPERALAGREAIPSHISMLTSSSLWARGRSALVGDLGFATSAPPTQYGIPQSSEPSGSGLLADGLEDEAGSFELEATQTDAARIAMAPPTALAEEPDEFASAELLPEDEVTDHSRAGFGTDEDEVTSRNSLHDVAATSIEDTERSDEIDSFEEADTRVSPGGGTESYSAPSASAEHDFARTMVTGETPSEDFHSGATADHTELEQEPSLTASAPPMSMESPEDPSEEGAHRPAIAPVDRFAAAPEMSVDDDSLPMPPSTLILSEPPSSLEDEAAAFEEASDEGQAQGPGFVNEPAPGQVRGQQDPFGNIIGHVRAWGEEIVAKGEEMVARRDKPPVPSPPSADGPAVTKWAVNPDENLAGPGTEAEESPSDFERDG